MATRIKSEDVQPYVEKNLLYEHMKGMRIITHSTIHEWMAMKARQLRDKINAIRDGADLPIDDELEGALKYLKGKK